MLMEIHPRYYSRSRFSRVKFVKSANGDTSEIRFWARYNSFRPVNLVSGERSDASDPQISRISKSVVNLEKGERSDTGLPHIKKCFRLIRPARADISDIFLLPINDIYVSSVQRAMGDKSDISGLKWIDKCSKLINPDSGDRSDIWLLAN